MPSDFLKIQRGPKMYWEFQVNISELKRLKGIRIEVTDDAQPFLIFTYKKRKMSERVLAVVCWSVVCLLVVLGAMNTSYEIEAGSGMLKAPMLIQVRVTAKARTAPLFTA